MSAAQFSPWMAKYISRTSSAVCRLLDSEHAVCLHRPLHVEGPRVFRRCDDHVTTICRRRSMEIAPEISLAESAVLLLLHLLAMEQTCQLLCLARSHGYPVLLAGRPKSSVDALPRLRKFFTQRDGLIRLGEMQFRGFSLQFACDGSILHRQTAWSQRIATQNDLERDFRSRH